MEFNTTMKPNKSTIYTLEEYLELHDSFIAMLQKMKRVE